MKSNCGDRIVLVSLLVSVLVSVLIFGGKQTVDRLGDTQSIGCDGQRRIDRRRGGGHGRLRGR